MAEQFRRELRRIPLVRGDGNRLPPADGSPPPYGDAVAGLDADKVGAHPPGRYGGDEDGYRASPTLHTAPGRALNRGLVRAQPCDAGSASEVFGELLRLGDPTLRQRD